MYLHVPTCTYGHGCVTLRRKKFTTCELANLLAKFECVEIRFLSYFPLFLLPSLRSSDILMLGRRINWSFLDRYKRSRRSFQKWSKLDKMLILQCQPFDKFLENEIVALATFFVPKRHLRSIAVIYNLGIMSWGKKESNPKVLEILKSWRGIRNWTINPVCINGLGNEWWKYTSFWTLQRPTISSLF